MKKDSVNRRDFLQMTGGVLAAAGALAGATGRSAEAAVPIISGTENARKEIPVGAQLYCVRHLMETDLEGTVASVAEAGFDGVEFADYFGKTAKEWRKILDDNGLGACGTHIYLNTMQGDLLKETIDFNLELGNPYLIVRWLSGVDATSRDSWLSFAEQFNEVAVALRPHGLRMGYHNHGYSFNKLGDELAWNIVADATEKDVILQLDTGNVPIRDDINVLELLKRNVGRSTTLHIKPRSEEFSWAWIGSDDLDWKEICSVCETTAGTEWYIIEYEVSGLPPVPALKGNLDQFRKFARA